MTNALWISISIRLLGRGVGRRVNPIIRIYSTLDECRSPSPSIPHKSPCGSTKSLSAVSPALSRPHSSLKSPVESGLTARWPALLFATQYDPMAPEAGFK